MDAPQLQELPLGIQWAKALVALIVGSAIDWAVRFGHSPDGRQGLHLERAYLKASSRVCVILWRRQLPTLLLDNHLACHSEAVMVSFLSVIAAPAFEE